MTMRTYKTLIFDWDGTLASSLGQIAAAVRYATDKMGLPRPSEKSIRDIIGLRLDLAFMKLAPDASPAIVAGLVDAYRETYLSESNKAVLYDGVFSGLEKLSRRYELTVATGKARPGLDKVLRETGLTGMFVATRTPSECEGKPSGAMALSILGKLGREPGEAIVIGDTSYDLEMARNAGCDSVAMLYGAHDRVELERWDPLAFFDDFPSLVDWLLSED